jgi:Golgi apparatus protein 1
MYIIYRYFFNNNFFFFFFELTGTCFNTGQGLYTCSCPASYSGKQCETYLGFAGHTSLISSPNSCVTLGCFNSGTCELVSKIS